MDVKGGEQGAHRPAGELQQAGHIGGHVDVDGFAAVRLAGDQPLGKGGAGHPGDHGHAAEQVHQSRQIIGPHVKEWAAAPLVVEIGIGMPAFMSTADHEGRGPHRLPDIAVVDQAAAGLQPGPQEGIGRAAEQQPFSSASRTSSRPSARSAARGFSLYTCLPASRAARDTSKCS